MHAPEFLTLADDPVLDLLNTEDLVGNGRYDFLQTDDDTVAWMKMMGFLDELYEPSFMRGDLLKKLRALRDVVRKLVTQRKSGNAVDIAALNAFLVHARYHIKLVRSVNGQLAVIHEYERSTPEQVLAGVAEAAAELLAVGDFERVKKCENDKCVRWFYDKTKAHCRRWCSMSLCGNRHKVANFRARQRSALLHK
ncbi:CGNR zinc finger domain-containing protein [Paraburkholderia oxyphila]|uniref:CGNR zinc finger domain-containing protein n=1 Tax=Paraburkholderia oxyphila TaxID=614212 RepID=UPI0005B766BE|nr:ABATE domain-containing protein [Paraburkholderia oxyphila]